METPGLADKGVRACSHHASLPTPPEGCPDEHLSDGMILVTLGRPSPTGVFQHARLRYLATLMQVGEQACWGLLNQDQAWLDLVQDDLVWMWHQLANTSALGDPAQHFERWLEIMAKAGPTCQHPCHPTEGQAAPLPPS